MRRWIVIFAVIILLVLLAGGGYYYCQGWWQGPQETIRQTAGGYDTASEPATLQGVLATAKKSLEEIETKVHDYSAVIFKQERVNKQLVETMMFAKIREKPFGVYLNILRRLEDGREDESVKGREVLYAQGQNDDKLLVHSLGFFASAWAR